MNKKNIKEGKKDKKSTRVTDDNLTYISGGRYDVHGSDPVKNAVKNRK